MILVSKRLKCLQGPRQLTENCQNMLRHGTPTCFYQPDITLFASEADRHMNEPVTAKSIQFISLGFFFPQMYVAAWLTTFTNLSGEKKNL